MKITTRKTYCLLALTLCAALAGACGGSDDDVSTGDGDGDNVGGAPGTDTVEMTSWWSGPGEAEALAALLEAHEDRNPGVDIFNSSESSGTSSEL